MSLLEALSGDGRLDPNAPADGNTPHRPPRPPHEVEARGTLALSLVGTAVLFIVLLADGTGEMVGGFVGLTIYLGLGYMFRPKPDFENLGWFGGLMDNPFRFSDGLNRFLLSLLVLLLPARFVSTSLADMLLPTSPDRPST